MILFDEYDPRKAAANQKEHHGVTFAEGRDGIRRSPKPDGKRLGIGSGRRTAGDDWIERPSPPAGCRLHLPGRKSQTDLGPRSGAERERGLQQPMKDKYDFSKGKRGVIVNEEPALEPGKVKISIRIDDDTLQRFFEMADASGGKTGYQTLINLALREYLDGKAPKFEDALRRIVREELSRSKVA
jgi:uncharacterized protein (DUF4415 family)